MLCVTLECDSIEQAKRYAMAWCPDTEPGAILAFRVTYPRFALQVNVVTEPGGLYSIGDARVWKCMLYDAMDAAMQADYDACKALA